MRAWLNRARKAASSAEPTGNTAAEWLLDNDYQVQRAVLHIKEGMPEEFYRRLPGVARGRERGFPRIHSLAHALLHASHLQISLTATVDFVCGYQEDEPLSMAEIWALPTMLRLACLEILVSSFARLFPNSPSPFDLGDETALHRGTDDTECVSRAIANLAVISAIPWKDFFDRTSLVESVLHCDPAAVYPRMDFATRDQYRHAIEQLSDKSGHIEQEVAERLVAHCRPERLSPYNHVGYWLIGPGLAAFEASLEMRPRGVDRAKRWIGRHPAGLYAFALMAAGLIGFLLPALYLGYVGATMSGWVLGIALSLLPASILSVTVVNWIATLLVPPRVLPKLDFSQRVADDCRTAVVVPVLVGDARDVPPLLKKLEAHYLSNPDPRFEFVLLSDYTDADQAAVPADAAIDEALRTGVAHLNKFHGTDGLGPFHLLHRPRLYNEAQGSWMGWERKRGKLEQFNRFVLHGDRSPYSLAEGQVEKLRNLRFVVTADADTRLPTGVVSRLVATLAHPLNRARFDPGSGRVTSGYTILQPRVEIAPESENHSIFARIFGGDTAIDIYSRAVSDVYQDVVGSGIFVGKGIYEIAPFEHSVEGKIPENTLLSHDLFEGLHGRAGLVSDIIVYEGFPSGYLDYRRRWHRWVRGDWQLLPWLFSRVPARGGKRIANRLSWFDRLKIFDNLRRSLVPPSLVGLLLGGWFVLAGSPWVWTLLALLAPAAYLFTDLVTGLARGRRRGVLRGLLTRTGEAASRWALSVIFLVSDAAAASHAIAITLWRLVARRRLLEWTSAAHVTAHFAAISPRRAAWRELWASPAFAFAAGTVLALWRPTSLPIAAPLLMLWLFAPEIAFRIGRARRSGVEVLDADDQRFLRNIARRTWLFFETFVRPEDNWLPPDNYQEPPNEQIAHRTSPTNVGMLVLSTLTAWKLGHIGTADMEIRLRNMMNALDRLDGYRGHMLNWYDTQTLRPLEPRYVSTVDSGNLAVSLVVMSEACREAMDHPILIARLWAGLEDTLAILADALASETSDQADEAGETITAVRARVAAAEGGGLASSPCLDELCDALFPKLRNQLHLLMTAEEMAPPASGRAILTWLERVDHHLISMRRDVRALLPWLPLLDQAPPECSVIAAELALVIGADAAPGGAARMRARAMLAEASGMLTSVDSREWTIALDAALANAEAAHVDLCDRLERLGRRAHVRAHGMDFSMLYDASSRLFHIGYNITNDRHDQHHYDLLASEARLASFFAIAKGDVPPEHWFFLGRPVTRKASGMSLVSWNGSMFEYLMPNLFLRSDPETLLGKSDRTAVDLQHSYGEKNAIPWGISESAFAAMGPDQVYRYRAFGVPGLGLRRGLARDLVVAPYATALALAARPLMAVRNLRALAKLRMVGRYGFYEAVDFTPARVPVGEDCAVVRCYMAHHHGMSMAALGNALCEDVFVRWFHGDPHIGTIDLLLNERIPWELPPELERIEQRETSSTLGETVPHLSPWQPAAPVGAKAWHAIGNGRLTSLLEREGSGGLMWQRYALTRPPGGGDDPGIWVYVRDRDSGTTWSAGCEPTRTDSADARVTFQAHQAEYHRRDHDIALDMTVAVSHADDIEIRRISIVNESDRPRTLDFTSFAEVVLAPPAEAARHPAFSRLFVHSDILPGIDGLIFTRRARDLEDRPPVLLHRVLADDEGFVSTSVETDRAAFYGRHGGASDAAAMHMDELGGRCGWTLDPVMAIRAQLTIPPHARRELAFLTIAAGSRESALEISERYAALSALDWAISDASSEADREIHRLGLDTDRLADAQLLLSALLRPVPTPQLAIPDAPARFARNDLWAMGISGDHPLVVLRDGEHGDLLGFLICAHQLWRRRGIAFDLVVTHDGAAGYVEPVRERLLDALRDAGVLELLGQNGGVHLVGIGPTEIDRLLLLQRAAHITLDAASGSVGQQLSNSGESRSARPLFEPFGASEPTPAAVPAAAAPARLCENGVGGFVDGGRAYEMSLGQGQETPAPWANILANDDFGTIVTEAGLGFTWAGNSGENRLTPWSNDSVCDTQAEILYLRDEETARVWTPTPQPAGADHGFTVRHGKGYTSWQTDCEGLEQELVSFVPADDPVKIVRIRLHNRSPRSRRITATFYAEWLLGAVPGLPAPLRSTVYDADAHSFYTENPWTEDFGERTAFLTSSVRPHSLTASKQDFWGRRPDRRCPQALLNWDLGNRQKSRGADCCGALQVHLDIAPGDTGEVIFALGQGTTRSEAASLARRWQDPGAAAPALEHCRAQWDKQLSAVQVSTPDEAFDILVNHWLHYQTISARLRARAGFYQAGGAFGFRDQLQDVLALLYTDPELARRHILSAAAHQFDKGDVLHWWHPPGDRGVRTRCSDDMLWLPYVTAAYVKATGDTGILSEKLPFLEGPDLGDTETDRYAQFSVSNDPRSLFEHCERALQQGHRLGAHGLPLMGSGDWNDGMSRVGVEGRGESVWLAWFLIATIDDFVTLCRHTDRTDLITRWEPCSAALAAAIDRSAWDGEWYLRAFDDDGIALGTARDSECQIDSIAQSWSVLSGRADPERAARAMAAARDHLVLADDKLVRLLSPAFDATPREPGYIKAYPPGIRENGGQYTHAAAWLGIACARLGDSEGAMEIFNRINPINHTRSLGDVARYRTEPYVLAADVAGEPPHVGRGGWSWYTGAAAWTWRLAVEEILGLRLIDGRLHVSPCIPASWKFFEASITRDTGTIRIRFENPGGLSAESAKLQLEGGEWPEQGLPFPTDGEVREVLCRWVMRAAETSDAAVVTAPTAPGSPQR